LSSIVLNPDQQYALQVTQDLYSPRGDGLKAGFTNRLHSGQIDALRPFYEEGVDDLMLACGRKFGKTEVAAFVLWKQALEVPGSSCYYIAPEAAHGRKLIWDNQRLQKFMGPDTKKYISSVRNQDMKITLKNGSIIQILGTDNWSVANGLTPHIAVYDEFKAFHPQWHIEFSPNRAAKGCKLLIIGTLPKVGDKNIDQYLSVKEGYEGRPDARVVYKTTFDNPINHLPQQKKIIAAEIKRLREHGDEDIVQREYYSKIVAGGSSAVFPMLTEDHVVPHSELIEEIKGDIKKMEWYLIADPGTTTCFACLFVAINPYSKRIYILDEIYEKSQLETSTRKIWGRMQIKCKRLNRYGEINEDWFKVYDEAGAWFANEVLTQFGASFFKTEKVRGDKEEGLSVIKDQLIYNMVKVSTQCPNLYNEMRMYAKNSKGVIPKKNDHLIDCYRYLNDAIHYDFQTIVEAVNREEEMEKGRFRRLSDDHEVELDEDWTAGFGDDFDLDI